MDFWSIFKPFLGPKSFQIRFRSGFGRALDEDSVSKLKKEGEVNPGSSKITVQDPKLKPKLPNFKGRSPNPLKVKYKRNFETKAVSKPFLTRVCFDLEAPAEATVLSKRNK